MEIDKLDLIRKIMSSEGSTITDKELAKLAGLDTNKGEQEELDNAIKLCEEMKASNPLYKSSSFGIAEEDLVGAPTDFPELDQETLDVYRSHGNPEPTGLYGKVIRGEMTYPKFLNLNPGLLEANQRKMLARRIIGFSHNVNFKLSTKFNHLRTIVEYEAYQFNPDYKNNKYFIKFIELADKYIFEGQFNSTVSADERLNKIFNFLIAELNKEKVLVESGERLVYSLNPNQVPVEDVLAFAYLRPSNPERFKTKVYKNTVGDFMLRIDIKGEVVDLLRGKGDRILASLMRPRYKEERLEGCKWHFMNLIDRLRFDNLDEAYADDVKENISRRVYKHWGVTIDSKKDLDNFRNDVEHLTID